ncbi:sulfite exporter TauE/SafE family protein [Candidatus Woesearchaeota archaeon]|nr:sulfite exporter TauE/SafE family protein [Candidatus Woesearchaeota archaeon]
MNFIPISLLGLGFLSGLRHAFDADHIAAVSTMASRKLPAGKYSLLGLFWGFGHTIALFLAGLAVLLLKITIPEKLASFFELIAAVMLIALGLNVLLAIRKEKIHVHRHRHGEIEHIHLHSHKSTDYHEHSHAPLKKSLAIGLVHGLAGSAALTLLVLAGINSTMLGLIYILLFGLGSMLGMVLVSAAISLPFKLIPNKLQIAQKLLKLSTGIISITIGLFIII